MKFDVNVKENSIAIILEEDDIKEDSGQKVRDIVKGIMKPFKLGVKVEFDFFSFSPHINPSIYIADLANVLEEKEAELIFRGDAITIEAIKGIREHLGFTREVTYINYLHSSSR